MQVPFFMGWPSRKEDPRGPLLVPAAILVGAVVFVMTLMLPGVNFGSGNSWGLLVSFLLGGVVMLVMNSRMKDQERSGRPGRVG